MTVAGCLLGRRVPRLCGPGLGEPLRELEHNEIHLCIEFVLDCPLYLFGHFLWGRVGDKAVQFIKSLQNYLYELEDLRPLVVVQVATCLSGHEIAG